MDKLQLRELIQEFAAVAAESILMADEINPDGEKFTVPEVLETWAARPDCHLTPMFLGYSLAKGININLFSLEDMQLAVQTILLGDADVPFDWLGDLDAPHKPH